MSASNRPNAASATHDPTITPHLNLRGNDPEELQVYWDRLAEGAIVKQPVGPSQWAPLYGQLTDRFGITWVLDLSVEYPAF